MASCLIGAWDVPGSISAAANREGQSLNAWVADAIGQKLQPVDQLVPPFMSPGNLSLIQSHSNLLDSDVETLSFATFLGHAGMVKDDPPKEPGFQEDPWLNIFSHRKDVMIERPFVTSERSSDEF